MSVGKAFARWLFTNHIRWVDSHTASVPISIMLTNETANLLNEQLKQIAAADVRQQPKIVASKLYIIQLCDSPPDTMSSACHQV